MSHGRTLFEQIREKQDELYAAQSRYLKKFGWRNTCGTPGSTWLWERLTEDGRTMLVDTETALGITFRAIDPQPYSIHDEELGAD